MHFTVTKDFTFSASHQLSGLPIDHQCARLHGHNYTVRVELAALELDTTGFVLDYGRLKPFQGFLDSTLDHRHLNDVLHFNPTAERMAGWLATQVAHYVPIPPGVELAGVGVSETPKTWAWWRP